MSLRDRSLMAASLQSNGYVRDLGSYERLMYLSAVDHPRHFCVVGEIAGELTAGNFRTAFDELQRRHTLLNVAIHGYDMWDGRSGAAFYLVDRRIDIEFKPLWQDYDWVREVERELATSLDGAAGPLMRAVVLQQHQKAQVILTFHHAIADGLSAAFIIRDLMVALNGSALSVLPEKPLYETLAARLLIPGGRLEEAERDNERAPRRDLTSRTKRHVKGDMTTVTTLSFSEIWTEHIQVSAKANGTTVHGALCAAVALSVLEENATGACTIMSPINIRQMLGIQAGECGIYLSAGTVSYLKHDASEYWAMARQVVEECNHAKSAERVSDLINMIDASVPVGTSPGAANCFRSALPHNAVVSNLGRLPIPETIGHLRLNTVWGPLQRTHGANGRFISAATVGNRLRIVQTSSPDVPSILDAICEHIQEAVKAPI